MITTGDQSLLGAPSKALVPCGDFVDQATIAFDGKSETYPKRIVNLFGDGQPTGEQIENAKQGAPLEPGTGLEGGIPDGAGQYTKQNAHLGRRAGARRSAWRGSRPTPGPREGRIPNHATVYRDKHIGGVTTIGLSQADTGNQGAGAFIDASSTEETARQLCERG